MELFDFIKILIEKPEEYKKLKDHEKVKFFFMTQRFMSINYPIQAQMFNNMKIFQAGVLDYWQESLTRLFKKVPPWIYVKTKGANKAEKIDWPSDKAVEFYLTRNSMSIKDLKSAVSMFGESALDPIHRIDTLLKENI